MAAALARRPLSLVLAALLAAALGALGWAASTRSVDFPVYYKVAVQVLHGDYEFYPAALYAGGPVPASGFRYAPAIAFLIAPIGWFPLQVSAALLFALKLALFVYVGRAAADAAGVREQAGRVMRWSILVVGGYLVEEFRNGNVHFVIVALMVLAFDAAERDRVGVAAGALALAIATKLTPIALLVYFAARRRFAVCAATCGVLALLAVAPAVVTGVGANTRLLTGFVRYASLKVDEGDSFSLRGVLTRYLAPDSRDDLAYPRTSLANWSAASIGALWLALAGALTLALAIALWTPPVDRAGRWLEFSVVLTAVPILSPHTQTQYLVALVVPAVVLIGLLRRLPDMPGRRAAIAGLVASALASSVLPLAFGGRARALMYESTSPYFAGTLVLLASLTFVAVRWKDVGNAQRAGGR